MNASPQVKIPHISPDAIRKRFFQQRSSAAAPASGESSAVSNMLLP